MSEKLLCLSCLHKKARRVVAEMPLPLPNGEVYTARQSYRRCDRCGAEWENTRDGDWRPAHLDALRRAKA